MSLCLAAYAVNHWAGYRPAEHHLELCGRLESVARGDTKRLIVMMPPRHGKSMLCSEYFPAWYMGNNPTKQIITATYAQQLADDFGRKVRNICNTDAHRYAFPDFRLSDDSQAANRFHTADGGAYYAVGAGGPITGRGADLLLIDDPIKGREDAESEVMRVRLKDWYTSVAYTRLMPGASIIIVQTRWHDDDLAGWLMREQRHEGWDILNLPAIAEPGDVLGRQEGAALWPEAYNEASLAKIKLSIGSRDWSALYQQRPSAAEGSVFLRKNWGRYHPPVDTPKGLVEALGITSIIQGWDTAFKVRETSDYSVGVTIGVAKAKYYVLDVWRDRVEFPDLKRAVQTQAQKWSANAVVIEDAAAGQSLIQELQRNTRVPLIPQKVDKDKVSRANAVTPTHEAGLIYLPEGPVDWRGEFEDELAAFPSAPHDDQVDAFVHAMAYARSYVTSAPEPDEQEEFYGGRGSGSWMR